MSVLDPSESPQQEELLKHCSVLMTSAGVGVLVAADQQASGCRAQERFAPVWV